MRIGRIQTLGTIESMSSMDENLLDLELGLVVLGLLKRDRENEGLWD